MRSLLVFSCIATMLAGQATWQQLSPGTRPSPREGHNLVFDPATQRTYAFFGRHNGLGLVEPFWNWDG